MEPFDWLKTLSGELDKRQAEITEARSWYDGNHPIPAPPPHTAAAIDAEARAAFINMQRLSVTNFMPPVVDVVASKLKIEGFRSAAGSTSTDAQLWDLWRRNHLVTDWPLATSEAVKVGSSCAIAWPGSDGLATITVEDPGQVIVRYAAGSRRIRAAALKRWTDDDGNIRANVYLPEGIYKYLAKQDASGMQKGEWEEFQPSTDDTWPVANPWRVVPVVELRANAPLSASLYGGGRPQFAKQITTQRRINATVFGRLTTAENQSFRQRWATDWDVPLDKDGKPDKETMVKMGAARIANFASVDGGKVQVGEFAQADFRPFLDAVIEEVKAIATTSSTPPYAFLLGDMVNVASDALARIEGTHIANVGDVAASLEEPAVETLRLALRMEGDPRADDPSLSVLWREFEQRTASDQLAIAQAYKDLGAPDEVVFAALPGVDQAEARRWVNQRNASSLLNAALGQ